MDAIFKLYEGLSRQGPGSFTATRRALRSIEAHLPDNPTILDLGCGAGAQTLVLAETLPGSLTAVDIHQPFLNQLTLKAESSDLKSTINCLKEDLGSLSFPDNSYDLIWSEGAIYLIGFQKGLNAWKPFLKPRGFIVVSEISWFYNTPDDTVAKYWQKYYPQINTIEDNLKIIENSGFSVVDYFSLTADAWWQNYYDPLIKRINYLNDKSDIDSDMGQIIEETMEEIDMFKKYSDQYGYEFYIMQNTGI